MIDKNILAICFVMAFVVIPFACLVIYSEIQKPNFIVKSNTKHSNSHFIKKKNSSLKKNINSTFLGMGEYDVCGHHLVNPFIYVAESYHFDCDAYAINLRNQTTGLVDSSDRRKKIMEMTVSSFGKKNLFFLSPEQTDYFLIWLEYYDKLSVVPPHCYSRWMGGLCMRALYEHKDIVDICRKMLEFTIRYHSDYNDYDKRVDLLCKLTACAEHITTSSLSITERDNFRHLLDEVIAPLPYYFFKPGWQWDPAFLYHRLTGSPQMSLFKSSQVWLARHDDWSFVDAFTGYSSRGTNKYAGVLLSLLFVCDAIATGRKMNFEPRLIKTITSSRIVRILDFNIPQYTYGLYEHAMPFEEEKRKQFLNHFYGCLDDSHVSGNLRYIPWDFKTIDDIARVYQGLPNIFKSRYGQFLEPLIMESQKCIAEKLSGRLMIRSEMLNGEWNNRLSARVDVLFNRNTKYKIWVEDGPKWCASSSLWCLCDHPLEGLILKEDAERIYGEYGGHCSKNKVAYRNIKARGLSPEQEHLLKETCLHYDENLRESLSKMTIEHGMLPVAFVVCSNTVLENGNIKRNSTPEFGCWDNAVNKATIFDRNNPTTRVFIEAKLSFGDEFFRVVWDNVWKVEDQNLTVVGIKRRLKKSITISTDNDYVENIANNRCPFTNQQYNLGVNE